jgi:hypothetical protein
MTRRRILEIAVAAAVVLLLLAVFLVRPTGKGPGPAEPIVLFTRVQGDPPEFASGSYEARIIPSPDSGRVAVLYPVQFEVRSELYITARNQEGHHLTLENRQNANNTPKAVGWLSPVELWVVVGYTWGTVSPGGDLYLMNPENGHAARLWTSKDEGRTQAVGLEGRGDRLTVHLVRFDENMDHPRDSTFVLPPAALLEARRTLGRG